MNAYRQLKISVDPELADSFKAACVSAGVSMTSELSEFMAMRTEALSGLSEKAAKQASYDTRRKRRHHIDLMIRQLEAIKNHEDVYMNNIPDNLQAGQAYEDAGQAIDTMEQALELLKDTY